MADRLTKYVCSHGFCRVEVIPPPRTATNKCGKRNPFIVIVDGVRGTFASHAKTQGKKPQILRDRVKRGSCWKADYRPKAEEQKRLLAETTALATKFLSLPRVAA